MGMLLLLIIAAVVAWFVISTPATDTSASTPTQPPSNTTGGATGNAPPADLGPDETWLGDIDVQSNLVVLPDSSLTDVEAQGYGARSGPDGLVIDRLDVNATVPFASVAAELGGDSQIRPAEGGEAEIRRSVEVLGRQLSVVATGTVEVQDGLIVVEPSSIDLGGPDVLSRAIAATVRRFVTIEQPIDGLPQNLILRDVTVQQDGFRAELSGQDVVLAEGNS